MDSDKVIERIRTLLQRTEERGASEAEENTAARMVCKLLRQFPDLLQPNLTIEGMEYQRHRAAAAATQNWNHWRPSGGFNGHTAAGSGDMDDILFARFAKPGYVAVRYTRFIRQNDNEILLLIDTNEGWQEVWLPLNKITMRTRVVWIDEEVAKEKNLRHK